MAALALLALAGQRRGFLPRPGAHGGAQEPAQSAFWIDPGQLVGEGWGAETDPRWGDELRYELSRLRPFRVDDESGARALRWTLESLSFIAAAEDFEISRQGVQVSLRLREPVACVPVGRSFQMVDAEGVLLTGRWPSPARWHGVPLPVLGPLRDGEGLFLQARAGDELGEPDHLDALDVALSMREHLDVDERRALGRVLIDATRARAASVSEPGVRLELEGRRMVLFGRAPTASAPGELPAAAKWRSLRTALHNAERDPLGLAWDLVDVRWDRPDIVLRHPRLALAEPPAPRPGASVPAARMPSRARPQSQPQGRSRVR